MKIALICHSPLGCGGVKVLSPRAFSIWSFTWLLHNQEGFGLVTVTWMKAVHEPLEHVFPLEKHFHEEQL